MKDLKETIKDLIHDYIERKIAEIEVDEDTDFRIYKLVDNYYSKICDKLDDLEDDVDTEIEQMNEKSDYENDLDEDNAARYRDLF